MAPNQHGKKAGRGIGSNSSTRASTGGRSKSKEYADLPEWARPDKGHKPPSAAANRKAAENRKSVSGGAANPSVGASPPAAPAAAPAPEPKQPRASSPRSSSPRSSRLSYRPASFSAPVGGSSQVVLVLVVVLLLLAEWKQIVVPVASLVWNGKSPSSVNWISGLGLGLFGLIIVFLATISDDMAGLMMIVTLGMLTVYLVENQGGNVSSLFNWLNSANKATDTTSAPPVVKTVPSNTKGTS